MKMEKLREALQNQLDWLIEYRDGLYADSPFYQEFQDQSDYVAAVLEETK